MVVVVTMLVVAVTLSMVACIRHWSHLVLGGLNRTLRGVGIYFGEAELPANGVAGTGQAVDVLAAAAGSEAYQKGSFRTWSSTAAVPGGWLHCQRDE